MQNGGVGVMAEQVQVTEGSGAMVTRSERGENREYKKVVTGAEASAETRATLKFIVR